MGTCLQGQPWPETLDWAPCVFLEILRCILLKSLEYFTWGRKHMACDFNCLSYFTTTKISFTSILVFVLVYICFGCTVYFSAFRWNPIAFKVSSWTNRFTFILEILTRSSRSLIREQDSTCMCQPYFTLYLASLIMSLIVLLTLPSSSSAVLLKLPIFGSQCVN